jgi:hypothetical protein
MKTLSQTETSLSQALFNWSADRISRAIAAIKPKYRADQIAAEVAASGNPSGA